MMRWAGLLLQLAIPAMVAVYTFNFGRWMKKHNHLLGAFGAYLLAAAAFLLSCWSVLRNNS